MPPARGHTTLSDLLADDVRDYFAREGVSDSQQQQAPTNRRSKSFNDRKKKQQKQKNKLSASSSSALPSSYSRSATPSERGGEGSLSPLRAGWANIETSSNSSPNSNTNGENALIHMPNFDENIEKQSYLPLQQQQQQQQQHQYQNRGQNTAERHNMNTPIRSNNSDNRSLNIDPTNNRQQNHQQQQHHRRHSSGSTGSFQSHHSRGSRGSISSRSRNVSAADAAFLKRYAEEKERTNMRMSAAKPNWSKPKDVAVETRAPSDSSSNNGGAYHSIIQSPRPPTVVGSHRPALPSIDNDDWEEDDRIERRDKRKMERKEARKLERHRRTDSSGGSPRSASGLSVISRRSDRLNSSDRGDSSHGMVRSSSNATFGTVGNSSVVYHNPYQSQGSREISQGSIMSTESFDGPTHQDNVPASAGLTPGTNASMSYSAESSQNAFLPPPPDIPYNNNHRRHNSMDRFLREQEGKQTSGEHDNRQERYSQQGNTQQSDTDERATRHVRPLSYLSASSESDGKSGERTREGSYPVIRGDDPSSSSPSLFGLGASPFSNSSSTLQRGGSPFSSNSGASKHPLIPDLARYSSADGSDLNSTLYGSAIYSSRSEDNRTASGDSIRLSRASSQQSGRVLDYSRQRYYEDESSDGSSYDSDESSYTSDSSYDGDSSSHSHSSDENHHRRGRQPKHTGYQKKNPNIRWEARNRDIERGAPFNERDRLSAGRNRGSKYSSIEKTRNKRNRYRSSDSGKHYDRWEGQDAMPLRLDDAIYVLLGKMHSALIILELFISNMPSLVGSLALAWASLGVDWFKWYEETFNACHPTHYHNKACEFTEFPGCFACETDRDGYQFFVHFHYLCSTIAFILCSFLVGKIMIAFPVVRDELANPTTAAPLGLLCMALMKVFAGNFGSVGEGITFVAAGLHTLVAAWFIFISVVYKTLPEPSWFANTTGIGLAAAKVYLYWTAGGYFLSCFSLLAFAMFYLVSLYRIHTNEKISTPVCWVQLSGPAVVLYGLTIFSQPGSSEDDFALLIQDNREHFYQIHRTYYMPVLHTLFAFCMVSMASSLYLLQVKWKSFREKQFSPAHVSFCAPMVAHCNAMQAYRSSLLKFSTSPSGTAFKLFLYRYWTLSLICGTVLVFVMSTKFFMYLPGWCQINVEDDELPPEPDETLVTRLLQEGNAGDEMKQHFVSAAVLQANESGALVRVLQDGRMKYVRSRRMPSMGFDPILNMSQLMTERERLLQHVAYAANPFRPRLSSFNDADIDLSFQEPDRLRLSDSSRHRHRNFMSFDASSMMRGHFD